MGFLLTAGKQAFDRQPSTRTFPGAVDRVLRACSLRETVSIESPSEHVLTAMAAVNDALERIVTAGRWDWRVRWINFEMQDNEFGYDLPPDYAQFAAVPTNSNPVRTCPVKYVAFERLVSQYPQLAIATIDEFAELDVSALTRIFSNIVGNATLVGKPTHWSVFGSKMFLFPIPNEAFYTEQSLSFEGDAFWLFCYHPTFKELTVDTDVIPVPHTLLMVHHWLSLAYFKQAMEYPDFQVDEARGEALLTKAVRRHKRIYDAKYAILGDRFDYGV